ncbi:hypothetical protein IV417_03085 [Alphaproteobacteria bacterium KMM 3653]|uniref:Uncharacterized protein n=1 Tax=Harenicola maris TaxID=2841044 RepID=A0AAP2CMM0_9RHOB|nr:hypothetical protein [Harenicola maris]
MLLSFIIAALAGALTPVVEPHLGKLLAKALEGVLPEGEGLEPRELRVIAFALMLILASVVLALLGVDSSLFWAALGGGLGVCALRIIAVFREGGEGA